MLSKRESTDNYRASTTPTQRSYKELGTTCTTPGATCYLDEDEEIVSLSTTQDSFFSSRDISQSQTYPFNSYQAQDLDEDEEDEDDEEDDEDEEDDDDDDDEDQEDEDDGEDDEEDDSE